jgi:hypothetical protein
LTTAPICHIQLNRLKNFLERPAVKRISITCPALDGDNGVNTKNMLRYISALTVIAAAVYFFYLQFKKNADAIGAWKFQH